MTKVLHLANVGGVTRGGGVHEVAYNFFKYQLNQTWLEIDPYLWFPGDNIDKKEFCEEPQIKIMSTYGNPNWAITKELFSLSVCFDYDLIHQHGIWLPNSLLSKRFRKKSGKHVIIQPHGYLEPFRLKLSKAKKKVAYFAYEKENLLNCSLLLACSEQEAINLKEILPQKEIAIISNGIPESFLNTPMSNKFNAPSADKKIMLFLSRIHPLKGLERFLKVINLIGVEEFNEWQFIIAGFEEVNHESHLKSLVKELNLDKFVTFVGPKYGQEKIDLISYSDLFVLPTFNENYGIVIAEALAREIPVLTTKGTPWKELQTMNCGFWVNNDEEGIEKGLREILGMSSIELKTMGKNGKKLIKYRYTWEQTAADTKALYDWVLGDNTKPSFVLS